MNNKAEDPTLWNDASEAQKLMRERQQLDDSISGVKSLEQQLRDWLLEANTLRPSRATGVPPAARIAEERARLRPLKIAPADLALRIPVSVSPMGVVMHDGHPYSMPPDAIGLPGTLYLFRGRVRIVAGRFSAEHERKFQPGDGSILPEHRAERVAAAARHTASRMAACGSHPCTQALARLCGTAGS